MVRQLQAVGASMFIIERVSRCIEARATRRWGVRASQSKILVGHPIECVSVRVYWCQVNATSRTR